MCVFKVLVNTLNISHGHKFHRLVWKTSFGEVFQANLHDPIICRLKHSLYARLHFFKR